MNVTRDTRGLSTGLTPRVRILSGGWMHFFSESRVIVEVGFLEMPGSVEQRETFSSESFGD